MNNEDLLREAAKVREELLAPKPPHGNVVSMTGDALPPGTVAIPPPFIAPSALNAATFPAGQRPPVYVTGGLVQANTIGMISGPPKARKSFALLDLAVGLASGNAWLGFDIPSPVRVLVVDLELLPYALFDRIRGFEKQHKKPVGDRLAVLPWRHVTIQPGATSARVCAEIAKHAKEHKADVILVDSVYMMLNGDESDPLAVGDLLRALVGLCDGAAVMYTHHFAKGSANAQNAKGALDRASGSSWWSRFCDVLIPLTPVPGEGQALRVEPSLRHHAPVEPFTIEWSKEHNQFVVLPPEEAAQREVVVDVPTRAERKDTKKAQDNAVTIESILHQRFPEGCSRADLQRVCKNHGVATGSSFSKALRILENNQRMVRRETPTGVWCYPPQAAPPRTELDDLGGADDEEGSSER
jgi:hypothetical protein